MKIEVLADAESVAREGAAIIAAKARAAVAARGRFTIALSGGQTPWVMLRHLVGEDVPWSSIHVAQVDERVAPEGDPDRNLTHLRDSLIEYEPNSWGPSEGDQRVSPAGGWQNPVVTG